MKEARILIITDGSADQASSRIRAYEYVPLFKQKGFRVKLIPRIPKKRKSKAYTFLVFPLLKRFFRLIRLASLIIYSYDFVYVHRCFLSRFELKQIKQKKSRLVYDVDDAIYLNTGNPWNSEEKAVQMAKNANTVTVASPVLMDFFKEHNPNTFLIHTAVDIIRFPFPVNRNNSPLKIGWIGSPHTQHFLLPLLAVFEELSQRITFELVLIGTNNTIATSTNYLTTFHEWSYENECELVSNFDIGIMPLDDQPYAKGKGGYKLLLYMAAAIPSVASPVGINSEIIAHGRNGFLASSEQDWLRLLEQLLTDNELRERMGNYARREAENNYDRKISFEKLMQLIQIKKKKNDC